MAITTLYEGVEYRSRLEARWAAFFTALGWHHTYEPFDGDGYIPDFLIHGDRPLLVEVKPAVALADYQAPVDKVTRGVARHWEHDLLIVGADPLPHLPVPLAGLDPAGLVGQIQGFAGEAGEWQFSVGAWTRCDCGHASLVVDCDDYTCSSCDNGFHSLGTGLWIKRQWAAATNAVKWRGRQMGASA